MIPSITETWVMIKKYLTLYAKMNKYVNHY